MASERALLSLTFLSLSFWALVFSGCHQAPNGEAMRCEQSCLAGEVCVDGSCFELCMNDGDCFDGAHCIEGLCQSTKDQNPSHVLPGASCDDGDPCTHSDSWLDGECIGIAACQGACMTCDPETGACIAADVNAETESNDLSCTDGHDNDCDGDQDCDDAECYGVGGCEAPECMQDSDCPGAPCQRCVAGACEIANEGLDCASSDACMQEGQCEAGSCTGVPVSMDTTQCDYDNIHPSCAVAGCIEMGGEAQCALDTEPMDGFACNTVVFRPGTGGKTGPSYNAVGACLAGQCLVDTFQPCNSGWSSDSASRCLGRCAEDLRSGDSFCISGTQSCLADAANGETVSSGNSTCDSAQTGVAVPCEDGDWMHDAGICSSTCGAECSSTDSVIVQTQCNSALSHMLTEYAPCQLDTQSDNACMPSMNSQTVSTHCPFGCDPVIGQCNTASSGAGFCQCDPYDGQVDIDMCNVGYQAICQGGSSGDCTCL